jgi:hypothetical protein
MRIKGQREAIVSSKLQLALRLKMLERWTKTMIRKARASNALAKPVAPGLPQHSRGNANAQGFREVSLLLHIRGPSYNNVTEIAYDH